MKSILLFGGTFDPVHNGHVAMAAEAVIELGASQLIIIPAGNPYQRARMPFASALHRAAMLNIAFNPSAGVVIDTREFNREGPTFTIDTLRELRHLHGETAKMTWLIGGDAFAKLDSWHDWQSLFALANFAVVLRQGQPNPMHAMSSALTMHIAYWQTAAQSVANSPFGNVAVLNARVPPVSSTDIRDRLKNHQSIRGLAPDGVCDYIEHHKLYHPQENT